MRVLTLIILCGLLLPAVYGMREFEIDELITRDVKVSTKRPCTIMFPAIGGISSIHGTNITKNASIPAGFYVEYTPRSNFFSVRATAAKVENGYINIVYHRKIVSIRLIFESDLALADSSIIFRNPSRTGNSPVAAPPSVNPAALIALLDNAKNYPLLKLHRPELLVGVNHRQLNQVNSFPKFDCIVAEGWRYNAFDTNVFKIYLKNKTNTLLNLDLKSVSVRIGATLYPASIVQCSAVIPPSSTTIGYVGIAGSPTGGRAEIALNNLFKFLITESKATAEKGRDALMRAVTLINDNMTAAATREAFALLKKAVAADPALSNICKRFQDKLNTIQKLSLMKVKLLASRRKIEDLETKKGPTKCSTLEK